MACLVDGCGKAVAYRGYCRSHYERFRRHGDALAGRTAVGAPGKWLAEFLSGDHPDGDCILWPYGKDSDGYGTVRVDGVMHKVHRYVCKAVHGAPPAGDIEAAHSCGNGHLGCIHPKHIRWATPVENTADSIAHGTHVEGERSGMAKLTADAAREIVAQKGLKTTAELANQFGVSARTIRNVQRGDTWQSARGAGSPAPKRKLRLSSLASKREAALGGDNESTERAAAIRALNPMDGGGQ